MGKMVIALFRPKPDKAADLMACMHDHLPVLREQGLATLRPSVVLRAADGTLLEIFEWVSQAAIDAAHSNPAVLALWQRYAACCDYVTLGDLAEARTMFPEFALVEMVGT
jgi:quinol monooxygenase YgiN